MTNDSSRAASSPSSPNSSPPPWPSTCPRPLPGAAPHPVAERDPGAAIHAADLKRGAIVIALLLFGGFILDLQGIRDRPFAWIRAMAQFAMGRTTWSTPPSSSVCSRPSFSRLPTPCSRSLPSSSSSWRSAALCRLRMPAEAPAWATWMAGKGRPGVDFEKEWRKTSRRRRAGRAGRVGEDGRRG